MSYPEGALRTVLALVLWYCHPTHSSQSRNRHFPLFNPPPLRGNIPGLASPTPQRPTSQRWRFQCHHCYLWRCPGIGLLSPNQMPTTRLDDWGYPTVSGSQESELLFPPLTSVTAEQLLPRSFRKSIFQLLRLPFKASILPPTPLHDQTAIAWPHGGPPLTCHTHSTDLAPGDIRATVLPQFTDLLPLQINFDSFLS